jgi:hypothetical protein
MKQLRGLLFGVGLALALGAVAQVYNFFPPPGMTYGTTTGLTIGSPTGGAKGTGTINATGLFVNGTATGSGTVSSVGLTAPSVFAVGGTPVTGSGTLAVTFATGQTQNQVLASPNGSSGAVALRALVGADVPAANLAAAGNGGVTGTLPIGNGGTGNASAADDTTLVSTGSAWVPTALPNCADTGGQHLNYATGSNTFSCGTSGGGGSTTKIAAAQVASGCGSLTNAINVASVNNVSTGKCHMVFTTSFFATEPNCTATLIGTGQLLLAIVSATDATQLTTQSYTASGATATATAFEFICVGT